MLETGLAIFALNLPPSWSLISRFSIGSVLQSLRSLLSLRSHESSRLYPAQPNKNPDHKHFNKRNDSRANSQDVELVPHASLAEFNNKVESGRAMYPHHTTGDVEGFISVERSMEQTESRLV